MRTKRMIAGIVAAVTLASVSASAIVTAAGDFGVSISKTEAAAGASFELTLDLENIPETGINACDFGISYDPTLVTIDEVTLGSLAKDVTSVEETLPNPFEFNIETDVISVMYALGTTDSAYYLKDKGTFLNISGTVKADAKAGSVAKFEIVPVDRAEAPGSSATNSKVVFGYMAADETTTEYDAAITNGSVTVLGGSTEATDPSAEATDPSQEATDAPKPTEAPTPAATEDIPDGTKYGDVNDDKSIDVADVVALNMYLLNPTANPLGAVGKANADCVRDKKIDTADSQLILEYITQRVGIDELGK